MKSTAKTGGRHGATDSVYGLIPSDNSNQEPSSIDGLSFPEGKGGGYNHSPGMGVSGEIGIVQFKTMTKRAIDKSSILCLDFVTVAYNRALLRVIKTPGILVNGQTPGFG